MEALNVSTLQNPENLSQFLFGAVFCAGPTRDAVPTVPLPVGKRRHGRCIVATVPTEARFGPRDIVVPEVGVEDIVVGALLKDMPKNHIHKEIEVI